MLKEKLATAHASGLQAAENGNYDAALSNFECYLTLNRKLYGPDKGTTGYVHHLGGALHVMKGDLITGIALLLIAQQIYDDPKVTLHGLSDDQP